MLLADALNIRCRIFAATINFNVESQTVILGYGTNARTLKRGNVNEHIFTAIIALDETESLHVVEELHRAIGTFAGRFAHRSAIKTTTLTATLETTAVTAIATVKTRALRTGCALGNRHRFTVNHKIGRRHLAATINQRKFQWLTLGQTGEASLFDSTDMNEHIVGTVINLDEAEALLIVEEFNDTLAVSNDLSRHCGATRSATTEAATTAAAAARAAETASTWTAAVIAARAFSASQFTRK